MYILSYSRLVLKKQQKISGFFSYRHIWVFPKIGYPQIIDSKKGFPLYFGVPLFLETPIWFMIRFERVYMLNLTFLKNNALDSPMLFQFGIRPLFGGRRIPTQNTPEKVTGTIDLNPEKRGESKGKLPHVWPFFFGLVNYVGLPRFDGK